MTLLAYGLERSSGRGGEALNRAMTEVVDARGIKTGWDRAGILDAIAAIQGGTRPDVTGAAGPLEFDAITHTDLLSSTYEHWRVEGRRFRTVELLPSGPARPGTADARVTALPSLEASYRVAAGPPYQPPKAKRGLWALLVAASRGWDNYRHQADVFAQYQMLRAAGVPASHIVTVAQDDLAHDDENPRPGRVPYEVGGKDVRRGVHIDYHLDDVDADAILAILAGHRSASLPKVIDSTAADNVYVYIAGHGDQDGVYVGLDQPVVHEGDRYSVLRGDALAQTVAQMHATGRYRRLLIAVEACKGGVLGATLDSPGALLVSAASPTESSLSTSFDPESGVWLADQFSTQLVQAERAAARTDVSVATALSRIYLAVSGSHVSSYGTGFGDAQAVGLQELVTP